MVKRSMFKDEEDYQGYLQFKEQLDKNRLRSINQIGKISKSWGQFEEPKVAEVKYYQLLEGEGVRHTIYVTGCYFNCKNCYNKKIQIQSEGYTFTKEMEDEFLSQLEDPFVDGVTFVGGEPLMSAKLLLPLAKRIRKNYPDKTIWMYTGYLVEDILDKKDSMQYELMKEVDILVDGQFITEFRDEGDLKPFRGSSNQRLISVKESVEANKAIEYKIEE